MFQRRYTLLVIRNVPLQADLSWLLLLLLVMWSLTSGVFPSWYENLPLDDYWMMGMVGALGLLLSVLLHEIAHIQVAALRKLTPARVHLYIFGGIPEHDRDPESPGDEGWSALAGPLLSLLLALGLWALLRTNPGWPDSVRGVLTFLLYVNLLLGAANFLPAIPLDGGRLLHALLWRWRGDRLQAAEISAGLSASLGTFLLVVAAWLALTRSLSVALWWFLIGIFIRHASRSHLQQATIRETLRGESLEPFLHLDPITIPDDLTVMEFVQTYLLRHEQRRFPIVDPDGVLIGCISPRDLSLVPQNLWSFRTVRELLRPCESEETISPDADALQAMLQMTRRQQPFLLVVEQGRVVGEVRLQELLEFLSKKLGWNPDSPLS
jgi:Zn-dependent protease